MFSYNVKYNVFIYIYHIVSYYVILCFTILYYKILCYIIYYIYCIMYSCIVILYNHKCILYALYRYIICFKNFDKLCLSLLEYEAWSMVK